MSSQARKKTRKSVMSRLAPLALGQRLDFQQLVQQGIPEAEARAIAQGYSAITKVDASDPPTDDYCRLFVRFAKALLPRDQFDRISDRANGDGDTREDAVGKMAVLGSEAHVDVPLGSDGKKRKEVIGVIKSDEFSPMSAEEMAYIKAALLQVPTESPVPGELEPELEPLVQANRLVAGMDAELNAGAQSAEDARRRASRSLLERAGIYNAVGVPPEVRQLKGIMLDLGCGQNREQGWLGVDLYAWDHGVIVHDLELGLPFPDGSVRAIRLDNSLHDVIDGIGGSGDPIPLLTECQRVLCEGGRMYYCGPEPLFEPNQRWPLPGLILVPCSKPQSATDCVQEFERVPLRVPAYHGADATFSPAGPLPLDVQMALAAYNTAPAETAMANLLSKDVPAELTGQMKERLTKSIGERKKVRVVKADTYRQIVLGVVLEPHTVDTQGDMMSPDDIEESAHAWLATSRVIGSEHGKPIEATPVESYIAPVDFTLGGELVTKGSWLMGTKIHDPEEWQKVISGEYEGYSVGGFGERE